MPVYSGGAAVREYLLGRGIRYVAYAYKRQANFSPKYYADYTLPAAGNVLRRQAAGSLAFQADVEDIAAHCRVIYRNGEEEVIDLATAATQGAGAE
jgi:hypothetical protein